MPENRSSSPSWETAKDLVADGSKMLFLEITRMSDLVGFVTIAEMMISSTESTEVETAFTDTFKSPVDRLRAIATKLNRIAERNILKSGKCAGVGDPVDHPSKSFLLSYFQMEGLAMVHMSPDSQKLISCPCSCPRTLSFHRLGAICTSGRHDDDTTYHHQEWSVEILSQRHQETTRYSTSMCLICG